MRVENIRLSATSKLKRTNRSRVHSVATEVDGEIHDASHHHIGMKGITSIVLRNAAYGFQKIVVILK